MWDFDTPGPLWDDSRFSMMWDQGRPGTPFAKTVSVSPVVVKTLSVVRPFR